MSYTIMQSGAMPKGSDVATSGSAAPAVGKMRSRDGADPSTGHEEEGTQCQTGSGSGFGKSDGVAKKSFRNEAERAYLVALIAQRLLGHAILFAKLRATASFSIAGPVCTAHTNQHVSNACFCTAAGAESRRRHSLGL